MRSLVLILGYLLCFLSAQGFASKAHSADLLESNPEQKNREERADGLQIYRHNLNYFISGQPDTKVQLSFKMRVLNNRDFYFGYTQTMFWELFHESSPFSDINYNPEVFHRWYLNNGILKGVDLGAEHRSNGRDLIESRSWNRLQVTARTEFKAFGEDARWNTKLFYLTNIDKTNRDIRNGLGFIETSFALTNIFPGTLKEGEIQLTLIPGGTLDWDKVRGSRELGFRFRLPFPNFDPFVYLQIYNGLNESLLFYKEDRTSYRIGLAI